MRFEVSYKGKRLRLQVDGESTPKELRSLLQDIRSVEQHVSESELRAKVVRQLKTEIFQDGDEELSGPGWWDVPQDLIRHKDAGPFLTMEADLNQSFVYDKCSFSLRTVITDNCKQYVLDREQLKHSLRKLSLHERFKLTRSILVRVKGSAVKSLRSEVEDYLRGFFPVDRVKVLFENKQYGDRASLEIVMFGDFMVD